MKFQKIIYVPGIVIGLGAALLLGSAARAQQEVEPTTFEMVPGEPGSGQAPGRAAHSSEAAKDMAGKVATQEATQNAATEARITQLTASDVAGMLVLMSGMGVIVLCAIARRWPKRYRNRFTQRKSAGRNGAHGVESQALDSVVKQWCERVGPPA
jgi:hypothetical protein